MLNPSKRSNIRLQRTPTLNELISIDRWINEKNVAYRYVEYYRGRDRVMEGIYDERQYPLIQLSFVFSVYFLYIWYTIVYNNHDKRCPIYQ